MKSKTVKIILVSILILVGIYGAKAMIVYSCSSSGYTVLTVNGILTNTSDALNNSYALKQEIGNDYHGQKISVDYLYNPSHLAGVGDILDSVRQGVFDDEDISDYDLKGMLADASTEIKTQKVLLVAHSQGNFYANSFYKAAADQPDGIPKASLGVYAVATPSDHVAGDGRYVTSDTDKVIAGVVGHLPFKKVLKPTDHITLQKSDDIYGHSFSDVYLRYASPKIISDIDWSLNRLQTNTIQKGDLKCMAGPGLGFGYRLQQAFVIVSDAVADAIADEVHSIAHSVETITSTASSVVHSLSETSKKLAVGNTASVIESVHTSQPTPQDTFVLPIQKEATVSVATAVNTFPVIQSPTHPNSPIPNEIKTTEAIIENILSGGSHGTSPVSSSTDGTSAAHGGGMPTGGQQTQGNQTPSDHTQDQTSPSSSSGSTTSSQTGNDHIPPTDPAPIVDPSPVEHNPTPPTITITGSDTTIQKNTTYTDPGATAVDSAGNPITVTAVSTVNPLVPGTYTITYTATDQSGNTTTVTRTVTVEGVKSYFDASNKIAYTGGYLVCDIDTHSVYASLTNTGSTTFVSSSNWQTSHMSTANKNMPIGKNFRIIFANDAQAIADCTTGTHVRDYSDTFHYETTSGSSVVANNGKILTSFTITNLVPTVVGIINDTLHSVTVALPLTIDATALIPRITISPGATISPTSSVPQDFTNPLAYMVTAPDGSAQQYTVHTVPQGRQLSFDSNNQILYTGAFVVCYVDTHTIYATGNNASLANFVSSTNWQTVLEGTPNINMPVNTNIRFIFGNIATTKPDCLQGTYLNDYSTTFYYATTSGNSVVYDTYVPPVRSSAKSVTSFRFLGITPSVVGVVDESTHTINATVPFGTDVKTLSPTITTSASSIVAPFTNTARDFTNPVTYIVTAEDGSTQSYIATVSIAPNPNPMPAPDPTPDPVSDTTDPPTITNYALNGAASDITINPLVNNLVIALTANKNVNWLSVKIENKDDTTSYRIFQSGSLCVDGTTTCTKTWDGVLSSGGLLHSGTYKIRVHIKDTDGNEYEQYLPPVITVDVPEQ